LLHSPQFAAVVVGRNPAMLGPEAVKIFLLPRLVQIFFTRRSRADDASILLRADIAKAQERSLSRKHQ
jgi:hypothetical protein